MTAFTVVGFWFTAWLRRSVISGRMIEEQENLFACGNASGEDQRLAVQLVDKRVLKLDDAVDHLRDDFAILIPSEAEELCEHPFADVENHIGSMWFARYCAET